MTGWFTERHDDRYSYGFACTQRLLERQTPYQRIEVWQTAHFGRLLALDGAVQLVESMEFAYHEALVHPAMTLHPDPKRVLIVGGGDGGAAREALRHPSVTHVDLVDIDAELVAACRDLLPSVNGGCFDDPRLHLHCTDGAAFLGPDAEPYDVILTDFTDPVGPAESVYEPAFFRSLLGALAPGGRVAMQCESAILLPDWHRQVRDVVGGVFPAARLYHQYLQMYGGLWSFALCGRAEDDLTLEEDALKGRLKRRGLGSLRLYGPGSHRAMFDGFTWAEANLGKPGREPSA
ncbi:MAG: polyamine aminopropyltransferase [Planctomycetota bacterium]